MEVEKDAANSTCTQAQTYAVKERVKSFDERCDDKTRKKLKLLLIIASVLAVLVELMLFRPYPNNYNAYYIAFCVIMACVLIAFNWEGFKRSKEGWFSAAVLITLLAAAPIMWGKTDFSEFEETLRLINHLFAVPLVGLLIPTIIGRDFQRNSVRYFMTGYAMNLAPNWFKHFSMPFRLIGKTKAGDKRMLGKVLIGVAIGIPVFVVLILLLSQANEGLNRFIHDLPELPKLWFFRLQVILLAAPMVYSFIASCLEDHGIEHPKTKPVSWHWNTVTFGIITAMMIIAYIIFAIFQFEYLSGFNGLPEEYTYSEYAVKGFGELNVVAFINICCVVLGLTFCKDENGRVKSSVKILLAILLAFSFLLAASAMGRLIMYINAYGLTSKRILAFWFETAILMVFVLSTVKLIKPSFRAVYWGAGIILIWYAILNYSAPIINMIA